MSKFKAAFSLSTTKCSNSTSQPRPFKNSEYGDYSSQQKKKGIYFPNIDIKTYILHTKKVNKSEKYIEIQCSVSKLLFGSSYYEPTAAHLNIFLEKLQRALLEVGLRVPMADLMQAVLHRVDFSKNLYFTNNENIDDLMAVVALYDFKAGADFKKTEFERQKNYQLVNHYRKSKNFKFYNKMAELQANGFTATEKLLAKDESLRVLRIECSLNKKVAMQNCITNARKQNGLPKLKHYTIADVFDESVARQALMTELGQVINLARARVFSFKTVPEDMKLDLIMKHISKTQYAYLVLYYVNRVLAVGFHRTEQEIRKHHTRKTSRHVKNITDALLLFPVPKTKKFNVSKRIIDELGRFDLQPGTVI